MRAHACVCERVLKRQIECILIVGRTMKHLIKMSIIDNWSVIVFFILLLAIDIGGSGEGNGMK